MFDRAQSDYQWIGTAYLLTTAAFVPLVYYCSLISCVIRLTYRRRCSQHVGSTFRRRRQKVDLLPSDPHLCRGLSDLRGKPVNEDANWGEGPPGDWRGWDQHDGADRLV